MLKDKGSQPNQGVEFAQFVLVEELRTDRSRYRNDLSNWRRRKTKHITCFWSERSSQSGVYGYQGNTKVEQ